MAKFAKQLTPSEPCVQFRRQPPVGTTPSKTGSASHRAPDHIDTHRNFVLNGYGEKGGAIDFEVGTGSGDGARDVHAIALGGALKRHVLVVRGLPGKLDIEINVDGRRADLRLREAGAHDDHRKLRAARRLDHV